MIKKVTLNIFGSFQTGEIKKDSSFHGGEKIIIETSGGTMSISTELYKKEI